MKNHIKTFILSAVISLGLSGCNTDSKLNPLPTTMISSASAFKTAERIENQVNGLYSSFKGNGFWGSHYIYYSEARSGNFVATHLNPTRGGLSYMMTVDPGTTDVSTVFRQGYQIINACNVFLEDMEKEGLSVVGQEKGGQYMAEAKFIRALAYYYMLHLYADPYLKNGGTSPGLPLRLKGNRGLGDYNLKRSTVAEVYKQILDDLNDAQSKLPLLRENALLNTTRAHRNTVIAVKTNVYMAMGNFDKVIEEANQIVSATAPFTATTGVANQLNSNIVSVFRAPFTSTESIFSMPFSSNDVPSTSLGNAYLPDATNASGLGKTGGGDFYLLENGIVAATDWKSSDKRRELVFVTPSGPNKGRSWCIKYANGSPYADFVPVIRYSQVLLNLAEALAQKSTSVDSRALELVNAVRKRSDSSTTLTASNKQDLINLILHERNIEFVGEGVQNIDLVRTMRPIPAKLPTGGTPIQSVQIGASNYIWPMPNSETLYNKDL